VGKVAVVGVFAAEAFLARNGFVSELEDSDFGRVRAGMGFGSSKGEKRASSESVIRVDDESGSGGEEEGKRKRRAGAECFRGGGCAGGRVD
jgi:hypothetical protein